MGGTKKNVTGADEKQIYTSMQRDPITDNALTARRILVASYQGFYGRREKRLLGRRSLVTQGRKVYRGRFWCLNPGREGLRFDRA